MTPEQITAAHDRLEFASDALRSTTPIPVDLVGPNGGPCPKLLAWCNKHGVSLDWIFRGDVAWLIREVSRNRLARA